MATGTKARRGKGRAKSKAAGTTKAKAKENGGKKREAAAQQTEALIKKVVAARKKGDSWATIGEAIKTTPGKAQYLMMLHRVAEGEVPAIEHKTEAQLVKGIEKARKAADEYSSWGWISARAGVAEGRIKKLAEDAGFYTPGKENIAQKRAGKNGGKATGKGKAKRGR